MGKRRSRSRRPSFGQVPAVERPAPAVLQRDDSPVPAEGAGTDSMTAPEDQHSLDLPNERPTRLSSPAVELVADLTAAIGAFEIESPIQQLPSDELHAPGLDGWALQRDSQDHAHAGDHDDDDDPDRSDEDDAADDAEHAGGFPDRDRVTPAVAHEPVVARHTPVPAMPAPETVAPGEGALPIGESIAAGLPVADDAVAHVSHNETASEMSDIPAPDELPPAPPREDPVVAARALAESGDVRGAIEAYRRILGEEPGLVRARNDLALLLEKTGKVEEAIGELDRALERSPDDVTLLCNRAAMLVGRMKLDDAEADLRKALRLEEGNLDALIAFGVLCIKRGRLRDAVEPLQRAAQADSQRPAVHYYLGEAYNRLDRLAEALQSYEMAAALQPANWRAHKGVGIMLDRLGRPADAAVAYRKARETQPR